MNKIPISVVVASRNEGHLLEDCLKSLQFCDEIIVYDLESSDNTAVIAKQYGAKLISHTLVPAVEIIRVEAVGVCKHPWMLFTDPDERITPQLARELGIFMKAPAKSCGYVTAPCIYYFKRRRLKGTMWGVGRFRPLLFNRDGVVFTPNVHFGIKLNEGFTECAFGNPQEATITHLWADSFRVLFAKHRRYFRNEGASRYNDGQRYPGAYQHLRRSAGAFYSSFIFFRGYKDGLNGFILSLLSAWYIFGGLNSLRRYEETIDRSN